MSKKVISWDIGIKNLSYCILQKEEDGQLSIIDWEVINLYEDETKVNSCSFTNKKKCSKKATHIYNNSFYCKKHSHKESSIIKKVKNNKNPVDYAILIKKELDKRQNICDVDYVLIENQPALVNPIMKSIQIIILSYFSFKKSSEYTFSIHNINAKCKEKMPEKDNEWKDSKFCKIYTEKTNNIKSKYSKRKLLCYYYSLLQLEPFPEMQTYLTSHTKKDDLTDTFLMCLEWFSR